MSLNSLSLRWKVLLGGLTPLLLLAIVVAVTIINLNIMNGTAHWVEHTHKVLSEAKNIVMSAVNMETGMRGYLLTGKEEFLDPYKRGQISIYEHLHALEKTLSDQPKQVRRLTEVEETLHAWQEHVTEPTIALRREIGNTNNMNDIAHLVCQKKGKAYFDKFRELMADFCEEEQRLMSIRQAENERRVTGTKRTVLAFALVAFVVGMLLSIYISRSVLNQLGADPAKIADVAKAIAQGDLTFKFSENNGKKSIGVYADMEEMTAKLRTMFTDIASGVNTLTASSSQLSSVSEQLKSNSCETTEMSGKVATAAEEMSANMNNVAAASEQTSTNVQMVAAASEEMSASIGEIASNSEKGRVITEEAVQKAREASANIEDLGEAAQNVGKVTETINEISEQTNLLALNATIEAARAGEAGKGFAVVANEIKDLAKQTAEATQDIRQRIEGMQFSTTSAVSKIGGIEQVVTDINEIVETIAASVEEQSSSTREISINVSQAAEGMQNVNENVSHSSVAAEDIAKEIIKVDRAAKEIADGSSQVNQSATALSDLAEKLNSMVARFSL